MRVFRLSDPDGSPLLMEADAPQPRPGPGELLIRICAAGVTPTELTWSPTSHTKSGEKRIGAIPGHEFSGVVAGVGESEDSSGIGREVFGMNDWFADGATAEYCIAPSSAVTAKPVRLSHTEAASVPIGALTAWQGLFERANLQPGEHVLVHGGAGAVGIFAVQLAKHRGSHVTATASARDCEFVATLGAERVIDYRAMRFEDVVSQVDVVFDTVGGETLERSWNVLKTQGRMVTIAAGEETAVDSRTKAAFFIVEPNQKQLTEIAALLDAQALRTFVAAAVPFSRAPEAYSQRTRKGGAGKVVIDIAA